MGLLHHRWFS